MTTKKLPTVIYKIHLYCNNFIAQLFQKTQKTGLGILHIAPIVPRNPPLQQKKILTILCVQEKIPYNRMKKLSL